MPLMEHYILSIVEDQLPRMRKELEPLMSGTVCIREFSEGGKPVNVTQRWIDRLETTIQVYEHVSRHCARRILER